MTISSSHNNIKIFGNIKSISNYRIITEEIDAIKKEFNDIKIHLFDSISITSSVIGYLCKLTSSGCNVELYIANDGLYDLLDDLNLLQTLNVQRITA